MHPVLIDVLCLRILNLLLVCSKALFDITLYASQKIYMISSPRAFQNASILIMFYKNILTLDATN